MSRDLLESMGKIGLSKLRRYNKIGGSYLC
jgi:hypothetical protein